jgi:CRISPR system Cascade subunit CasA
MTADAVSSSILERPTFSVRGGDGVAFSMSLADVLATLSGGEIDAFLGLQAHQAHAWHAFLVQLAAIAVHRAGLGTLPTDAGAWKKLLLDLTDGRHEPWTLVVEDLSQPAFMQTPVPEGNLGGFRDPVSEPDQIDVLITTRNHDVKGARIHHPRDEHWAFSLVSLQTMEGFSGRMNYGIARMNGGFGSRIAIGLMRDLRPAARFRDDTTRVLESRLSLLDHERYGYAETGGLALCWLAPWSGITSLAVSELDPFFIEVCRRLRLVREGDGIVALRAGTIGSRIDSETMHGDTGDAWTPVDKASGRSLTISDGGFHYALVQRLLLRGDFAHGAAMQPLASVSAGLTFTASSLARGQGKTNGLHVRDLKIPSRVLRRLGSVVERDALRDAGQERVDLAAEVRKNVLRIALCVLIQSGGENVDFRDTRPSRWLDAFERSVDHVFFDELWRAVEIPTLEARGNWLAVLKALAKAQLDDAIASMPLPVTRRYRAIAAAERAFFGTWAKHFPTHQTMESE